MKYIDVEKLIAEIERLKGGIGIGLCEYDAGEENGKMEILTELSSFIATLQQENPPLPSNLDEAASKWVEENATSCDYIGAAISEDAFKAGAEWMAGQGETFNGFMSVSGKRSLIAIKGSSQNFKFGEDVIVQIRKKWKLMRNGLPSVHSNNRRI